MSGDVAESDFNGVRETASGGRKAHPCQCHHVFRERVSGGVCTPVCGNAGGGCGMGCESGGNVTLPVGGRDIRLVGRGGLPA